MKNLPIVLVTAAAGAIASRAIYELLKTGVIVRALVLQQDDRAEELVSKGVEVVVGNLLNPKDVAVALENVTSAYFDFPVELPGILDAASNFIGVGRDKGLKAIVNMSQISADRLPADPVAQDYWIAERTFDSSGIDVTHLRPLTFPEWLYYRSLTLLNVGNLQLAAELAEHAPIKPEDVGILVAKILLDPTSYKSQTLNLFGTSFCSLNTLERLFMAQQNQSVV